MTLIMVDTDKKVECEFNKEDLLRLLACLQSELEAREMVIETLKAMRVGEVVYSNYGPVAHLSNENDSKDPFSALQRDGLISCDKAAAENCLKSSHGSQILQLENLIATQKTAQLKMRERIQQLEEKCTKTSAILEEQRKTHERDAAQGDDLLVMLEKEREKLRCEIEAERAQKRKLEKDLKRVLLGWKQQKLLLMRQRHIAVGILKEQRHLRIQNSYYESRIRELEAMLIGQSNETSSEKSMCPPFSEVDSHDTDECSVDLMKMTTQFGTSDDCSRLQEKLSVETAARKELQRNFEKLQQDYEKLRLSTNQSSSTSNVPSVAPSTSLVAQSGDSCSMSTPRSKPNPPLRRSSEGPSSKSSIVSPNGPTGQFSPDTVASNSASNFSLSSSSNNSVSSLCPLTLTLSSQSPSLLFSESRSSTPSPPPPPPPVQLHYPYPIIQSHLHHSQPRTSTSSHVLTSTSRPFSVPPHSPSIRSVPGAQHAGNPHQQPGHNSYSVSRLQSASSSITSRKSGVTTPAVHPHTTGHSSAARHPYSSHFTPSHTKHATSVQPNFVRGHSGPAHTGATHHFPYSPNRVRPVGSSGHANIRTSRASSITPSSACLSGANTPIGSGHLCINGK